MIQLHHSRKLENSESGVSDFMGRIEQKLDVIVDRLARVEASYDHSSDKLEILYEQHLTPLIAAVTDNQKKIAEMEVELAKLKTKIAIWGSIAVIIFSTIISVTIANYME